MTVGVVVTAAGRGERLGHDLPKALVPLGGRTLLEHAVSRLSPVADELVVTAPADLVDRFASLVPSAAVVAGGDTRQESVRRGLAALSDAVTVVVVHDAARALAPTDLAREVIAAVEAGAAGAVPALPVTDTVKVAGADRVVTATLDRSQLWAVQTPQGFDASALREAHAAGAPGATDDASLIEAAGGTVVVVDGSALAVKITVAADLVAAAALLEGS